MELRYIVAGNWYIKLNIIGVLPTKWVKVYSLRDQMAPTVANVPVEQLFDQAWHEFESKLFLDMGKRLERDEIHTGLYWPACNGMLEHYHWMLSSIYEKIIE